MTQRPLVWVLQGHHAGDNAQARELARQLGWRAVLKPVRYNWCYRCSNLLLRASLASVDRQRSVPLAAPWPDLVIGIGRRSVPVARWIKRQSGGATTLVHLGRPRAPLRWFDLVVTTPQYGLPPAPNVVELPLPLALPVKPTEEELAHWSEIFAALPRPWTGLLVGGARQPFRFEAGTVGPLLDWADQGTGALLVSTSPRTPREVTAALQERAGPAYVHCWGEGSDNPHQAILALADRFVVTCDSISMMAEASATGKPVRVFELPRGPGRKAWNGRRGIGAWLVRHGLATPPRDLSAIRLGSCRAPIDLVERVTRLVRGG